MRRWLDLIDSKCEADNSEKCKSDLQSLNFAYVPDVWREGCSKRILVTEFIDGIKISDTALLKERGYSVTTIDERLIKIMAEQVIQQLNSLLRSNSERTLDSRTLLLILLPGVSFGICTCWPTSRKFTSQRLVSTNSCTGMYRFNPLVSSSSLFNTFSYIRRGKILGNIRCLVFEMFPFSFWFLSPNFDANFALSNFLPAAKRHGHAEL